ncbi:hypothetical protein BF95_02040 [Sphingobium sp. Ant17]|nr:hypothetical protein BF95_02040 [Sphingobium sp. Ant17]
MVAFIVLDEEVAVATTARTILAIQRSKASFLCPNSWPVFRARPLTMPRDSASATTSHQAIGLVTTHHAETMSEA